MNNIIKDILKAFIIVGMVFLNISSAFAFSKAASVKEGNDYYSHKLYDKAVEKYKDALSKDTESDIINFNLGTALYKKNDYQDAIGHFQKALLSDDDILKKNTYFNLGNSLYKEGMAKEEKDLKNAISSLEDSLAQYEKTLKIDKEDKDAKFNHTFVTKELKRLKKKLEQQQKKQQEKQKQQKQKDKQDKEKQQQGQEQDKQQKSQSKKQQGSKKEESKAADQQQSKEDQQKKSQAQQSKEQKEKKASEDKKKEPERKDEKGKQGQKQQKMQSGEEKKDNGNKEGQAAHQINPQEMTKNEAEMLLRKYQQTEEPKGLLKFNQQIKEQDSNIKDW